MGWPLPPAALNAAHHLLPAAFPFFTPVEREPQRLHTLVGKSDFFVIFTVNKGSFCDYHEK
jgi:hypothetical protein